MALSGLTPFISTFAVFTSMRAGEQVRTDICYQNLPCRIIATHAGVSFGQAGTTHHCTEDIAILRSMANMTVLVPADGIETAEAVRASVDHPGPVYIRIGRGFEPLLYEDKTHPGFEIGKAIELRPGTDITVIACGVTALQGAEASRMLEQQDGLSVRVLNMHSIKPIDRDAILSAALETRRIVTVEEHNVIGGLGSAVAEVIIESGKACAFRKIGLQDTYAMVGIPDDLYSHYSMDADGIAATVRDVMGMDFEADEDWEDEV
jgi:transketolase